MEYVVAGEQDIISIYDLVRRTIQSIYPKYYPAEVVGFFRIRSNGEISVKKYNLYGIFMLIPYHKNRKNSSLVMDSKALYN